MIIAAFLRSIKRQLLCHLNYSVLLTISLPSSERELEERAAQLLAAEAEASLLRQERERWSGELEGLQRQAANDKAVAASEATALRSALRDQVCYAMFDNQLVK